MKQTIEGEILFAKIEDNEEIKIPSKRDEDGGYDLYPFFEQDCIRVDPGEIKIIPTGIATAFSPNYVMIVKERGSTGSKCMSVRMGVVDSGYRDQIFIGINNTSNRAIIIAKEPKRFLPLIDGDWVVYPYSKAIAQAVVVVKPMLSVKEVSFTELQEYSSERGLGSQGSSGK